MTKNYQFRFSRSVFWIVLLFYMCTLSNALWAGEERGTNVPFVQSPVTGTVISKADGLPLPGATIMVKGSTVSAQTDFDGKFSIAAPADAVLVFSFTGFKTIEIPLKGQTTVDITMEENLTELEEVVVIGYGKMKKKDLTGSIVQVLSLIHI